VDADGAVDFPPPAKQAAEREMRFDGLVVDPDHLQEMLERLVGLLVEQEIESLEVVDVERRRCTCLFVALAEAAERPAGRAQQQEEPRQQECGFSRHR